MARSFSDLISDISIAEQGSTGSRSFYDLLSALESQSAPARQFSPSFDFVGPVRPGEEYSPEFVGPIAPPSPRDALQRQVDATIAARETSQRYATLPKRVADVYNVYKNEDLAREALDLADQLKIEYPEYGEDIEDLLMKGLRPEDIRTQITQKRERKRRQSELATQYPDFARDVDKLFKEGFSPEDVTLRMEAMAGAKARVEQRKAEEAATPVAKTEPERELAVSRAQTDIYRQAAIRIGQLENELDSPATSAADIEDRKAKRQLINSLKKSIEPVADQPAIMAGLEQLYQNARGFATGGTFGLLKPVFAGLEEATGGRIEQGGLGETVSELGGTLATGIGSAAALAPRVAPVFGGLSPIAQRAATAATVGAIQSGTQSAIALATGGDISAKDAAANIGQSVLSSAIAAPIAATVPGRVLNAASQIAGDFVVDLAADVAYRDRLKDQSFVDWLLKEELPNLAVSIAGAGKDVLDARAAKTEIRRLFDQRMRSGEATPPPTTGAEPESVARPAGVPEQTPEQRQYVLDQVLMEEAGRANIADYERMMETSRQETARRAEEAKRFQETVKAREAGKQADELLRRLEEARAKKPETEVTGEGPVTGVMPEDKYIGKQITAGMIGEREIGALYGRRDQLMKQLEKAKPGIDYDVIQSRLDELNRIIDENKPGATTDYSSADDLRSKLEEKIKGIESYTERRLALEDDARLHGVQFAGRTPDQIISDITASVSYNAKKEASKNPANDSAKISAEQSDSVKVFRGVAEAGQVPQGGAFFTDSMGDASAYAELAALRKAIDENEELSDIVSEVMAVEGAENITDLSISTIKNIIESNDINVGNISKGSVLEGRINLGKVLNLESFGSEIKNVKSTWNELQKLGLVKEKWDDLDEYDRFDIRQKYKGKAFYTMLEGEVDLKKQFEQGIDTVVFTDQGTEGESTHRTYLTKSKDQFLQDLIPVPRTEEKPAAPVEKPQQQRAASDIYSKSEPAQEPIVEAKPLEARSAFEIAMARGKEPLARKEDVSEVRPEQVAEPVAKPFNYGDTLKQLDINALREDIKILGYKGGRDRLVSVAEKFGLPTEGTPKQILKKIEEAYNAAKERQIEEGGLGEYRGDGARVQEEGQDRIITPFIEKGRPEAGGGYRPAPGGNVPTGPVGRGVQGQQAVTPTAGGAVPPTTPPPAVGGAAGAAGAPAPAGRVYTRLADTKKKVSSIFGKIGENVAAQNIASRVLGENQMMSDASANIGRELGASIDYLGGKLSKNFNPTQVESDLLSLVNNTGSVTVPAATITRGGKTINFAGGTFTREDINDMSYGELVEIAKAGGWYNASMNSADDLKKLALQQTKSDITIDDFASKYNLTADDKQFLSKPFDDAKDFAKSLGLELQYAGMVDLGNYIASQNVYAQRKYLRNIMKGKFEPDAAARAEAEDIALQGLNRRIDQRSGRLAKIDPKGVNIASYMNTDDPKQAAQIISGLDLDTQRELVDMRDFYRKAMNQAVNVIEQTTPTGRSYTFEKKKADLSRLASYIVDEAVKPPDESLKAPTSGGGSAMDSLMKRDLSQVFQRLFGRIDDPAAIMAASRETQANLIGRYQSIRKLAESSELFTDDPVLASQKKWVRLAGSQRSTDPITDNDRKRYGVLAGMHAPESVKALLTNEKYYAASFIPQTIRGVEDALNKVSSVTRGGKVIFAPKSSIRDALTTAVTSSLGSGDIPLNPKQWTKEVSDVYSILRKYAVAKAKGDQKGIAEAQRFFRYLAETGIYKPGSSSYWDDMANAINGEGKISTIWKNLAAGRSYLTDMPFKVAGYNVRYKEALKWGWSEQKAKAWALDNIRRHYDNRDAVPKAFRDVAAKSTSPDYLPFKYSIARARMLQAVDAFSRDLKNKDIPPEAKARIIYGFFASTATTPALAIGKYGNKILKYGAVLATAYKGTEMMSDNAETADEKVDNAVRYISPAFAQRDPMVTFVDDKDGKKRLVTFSLTGAFTANPLEEYALGGYQTAGDKGLSKSMIEKLAEYGVGGDVPMVPNMLYQFMAGEPIGAYYQREGFFDAGAKSVRALSNALKLTGDAREEQFSLSKQYGTDALIRLAELGTAPLGSVIQTPVKALGMEERKKALEREVTQERKEGRVPMGYGEEEGRPVSEYMPTRTIGDLLMQGVAPHNVRIMEESDVLFNLRDRADTLRRATTDLSKETAQARRELDTEERRKAKKPLLDSYFTDWKEQSEQLLSLFGSKDIRRDQADILAKAGLADWEIEYILGIPPPTKSELPGLNNLRGGLKTIK